jgi:hypothetical protein
VTTLGIFPPRTQRLTVFGETSNNSATSDREK